MHDLPLPEVLPDLAGIVASIAVQLQQVLHRRGAGELAQQSREVVYLLGVQVVVLLQATGLLFGQRHCLTGIYYIGDLLDSTRMIIV